MARLSGHKAFPTGRRMICLVVFVTVALFFSGCLRTNDSGAVSVNPRGWKPNDAKVIKYANTDTLSSRSIKIFMIHESSMRSICDSLPLLVTTLSPDSLEITEPVTFHLCFRDNGIAGSEFIECGQTYRSGAILQEGTYTFSVRHNNPSSVKGIRAVGIEISAQ